MERSDGTDLPPDLEADAALRDRTARARDRTAEERDRAGDARDQASDRRDIAAEQRDHVSDDRDRLADLRDAAGDRRDEAADRRDEHGGPASESQLRAEAAADRRVSADDRQLNALDRQESASERASAGDDRVTAGQDRAAGDDARQSADADRAAADEDRGESATERQAAYLDDLTGALRRGPGFLELDREVARSTRTGDPLAVAFVDVDGLKTVNDSLGHAAGDRLLRAVSKVLTSRLRPYDAVMRYGGDEFVCVMSGLTADVARRRLSTVNTHLDALMPGCTVSAGVAQWTPGDTGADLVRRADEALHLDRRTDRASARD